MTARKGSSRDWLTGVQKHVAHRPFSHALLLMRVQDPAKLGREFCYTILMPPGDFQKKGQLGASGFILVVKHRIIT